MEIEREISGHIGDKEIRMELQEDEKEDGEESAHPQGGQSDDLLFLDR